MTKRTTTKSRMKPLTTNLPEPAHRWVTAKAKEEGRTAAQKARLLIEKGIEIENQTQQKAA